MKNNLFKLFLLAVTITFSTTLLAQNTDKQRLSREELATAQAKHIVNELALSDAITKQFIETFCECQKELWALQPEKKTNASADMMTEEETKKVIQEQFEHSQKILDIRKDYYAKYSKFLSQKQIKRVYDLEKRAMTRFQGKSIKLLKHQAEVFQQRANEQTQRMEERKKQMEQRKKQMEERKKQMEERKKQMEERKKQMEERKK